MDRAAKSEMAAGPARELIGVGIWILPVVAVARTKGEADEIAFAHPLTVQLHLFCQASPEALRAELKKLLDHAGVKAIPR